MANAYTGAGALCIYAVEDTYGTDGGYFTTPSQTKGPYYFGIGCEVSDVGFDNQVGSVYGLGDRESQALYPGTFKGAMTIDFDMCLAGATTASGFELPWLNCILGTYSSPTYSKGAAVSSISIRVGFNTDTDAPYEWHTTYLGCVVNRATFSFETGGVAHVKLDVLYANQSTVVSGGDYTNNAYALTRSNPFTFCGISMDTDVFGVVERADLTIEAGTDLIYGLGTRAGQAKKEGTLNYKITATNVYNDPTKGLGLALGDVATPLTVNASDLPDITGGIVITAQDNNSTPKTVTFTLSNAKVSSHKTTPIKVGEAVMEEIEIIGRSLTIAHPT